MFREFAGLDLGEENLPDDSTIPSFRHLLEKHQSSLQLLVTLTSSSASSGM